VLACAGGIGHNENLLLATGILLHLILNIRYYYCDIHNIYDIIFTYFIIKDFHRDTINFQKKKIYPVIKI